jgi:hypothetical protein
MKPRPAQRLWLVALLLPIALSVEAALVAGGVAFSKRMETRLLAEPRPLAEVTGKIVGYAKKLTVAEARGAWLRVSEGTNRGWVFKGSVSETEPEDIKGLDSLGLAASQTTATAAARPLDEAAAKYATEHKLVDSRQDLEWLLKKSTAITAEEIDGFMQTKKLGEFK